MTKFDPKLMPNGLAYELNLKFWDVSYASEACQPIIKTLFTEHQIKEIIAEVDTGLLQVTGAAFI